MNKLVLILGPSASGKSTLATQIVKSFPNLAITISQDSYYWGNKVDAHYNFDSPDAIDYELMTHHVHELVINNMPVHVPVYDYERHQRTDEITIISPKPLIILEGILLASYKKLLTMSDLTIYCDVPLDICLVRRIRRDIVERGRNLDSVLTQYEEQVRPLCLELIKCRHNFADKIFDGKNFDQILSKIKKLCHYHAM